MTKLLGVIGDPISHSLSPLIHNGWLRDLQIDAAYEALHVPDGEFDSALKTLAKKDVLGVNVTLPHKASALRCAGEVGAAARSIGAANTLTYLGNETWRADNTDASGFMSVLGDVDGDKDHALILGAGGSARAIVFALTTAKIPLTILNRTEARARELCHELAGLDSQYGPIDQYKDYIDQATIVINTTSMGYSGDLLDLPAGKGRTFFDISYGKISAPQLAHANEQGWRVKDGLSMLVAQAAFSFEIWFGTKPDLEAGLRRCRAALEAVS